MMPALADIVSVEVTGQSGAYQFAVEIRSPDLGCDQYADWWEIFLEDGTLVYRRILAHSHVGEQPFTRSGGPVEIQPDTVVLVRAHMHPDGYGGQVLEGTVDGGFTTVEISTEFAQGLEDRAPLPDGCGF